MALAAWARSSASPAHEQAASPAHEQAASPAHEQAASPAHEQAPRGQAASPAHERVSATSLMAWRAEDLESASPVGQPASAGAWAWAPVPVVPDRVPVSARESAPGRTAASTWERAHARGSTASRRLDGASESRAWGPASASPCRLARADAAAQPKVVALRSRPLPDRASSPPARRSRAAGCAAGAPRAGGRCRGWTGPPEHRARGRRRGRQRPPGSRCGLRPRGTSSRAGVSLPGRIPSPVDA